MMKFLNKLPFVRRLRIGCECEKLEHSDESTRVLGDEFHVSGREASLAECAKPMSRTQIINKLLTFAGEGATYLEIGVRDPNDNFDHIQSARKYSVDPGIEFVSNPVDFKVTSDRFFQGLQAGEWLDPEIKFDVIFIDGLHTAAQVSRDIENALKYIRPSGFIVLHDCNPPTEWHARENYAYKSSPAEGCWNGTVWKAFVKWGRHDNIFACCVDSDWGVGVLSLQHDIGRLEAVSNEFYEFEEFSKMRSESLNLVSCEKFERVLTGLPAVK